MGDSGTVRASALLITRNLPPLRGGMERLILHVAEALAQRYDLAVVGPERCAAFLPKHVKVREVAHHPLPRFLFGAAKAVRKLSRRDVSLVFAGSGLTAPLAWWAARRARAPWVVYLHGLDIVAPSVVYQRCWLPFIRRANLVLVNSRNTRRLAIERGVPRRAIRILHPGTDLPVADLESGSAFRTLHNLGERPLLLSVGRLTPRKGLAEFIQRALPAVVARYPDVLMLVIGADAKDAVQTAADSEHARILRSAREAGVSTAVRMLPPCDDATLSAAYRAADVHVFPVLDLPGDVEGFGMVAIEAAAHGLPTISFNVGGVADAVVEGVTGSLVGSGDYLMLSTRVHHWLEIRDQPQVWKKCVNAASIFNWDRFEADLEVILEGTRG